MTALPGAGFEHPATLERARWLSARARAGDVAFPPVAEVRSRQRPLDHTQLAAAHAPGGVVQVIAPAGSGKTTVLVERVGELLARGAEPERVLCMTFNDAAAAELRERLDVAGAQGVAARTFHSVGHQIIRRPRSRRRPRAARRGLDGRAMGPLRPSGGGAARCPGAGGDRAAERVAAIRLGELARRRSGSANCPRDDAQPVHRPRLLARRGREGAPAALRLRRHDRAGRAAAAHRSPGPRALAVGVRPRPRRRVPGHRAGAGAAGADARRTARRPLRRRRRGPDAVRLAARERAPHASISTPPIPRCARVALEHNYRCTPEVVPRARR